MGTVLPLGWPASAGLSGGGVARAVDDATAPATDRTAEPATETDSTAEPATEPRAAPPAPPATEPDRSVEAAGPELLALDEAIQGVPSQPGFTEEVVFSGLTQPVAVAFAPNGHVFVAEKRGIVKRYDSLTDTTPTTWADLRPKVHNFWDRGLLGMAVDPAYPGAPKVYVGYTHDAPIGGSAPRWGPGDGSSDPCPNPPGPTGNGCVVSSRISALTAPAGGGLASELVLVEDWCQQYPSHSISDLVFGPDGALYAAHGDGASFTYTDYGQQNPGVPADPSYPHNPCGDPPGGVGGSMTMPTAAGGMLRSQDVRTLTADPLGLNGTVIRISPTTGAGLPGNPMFGESSANAKRVIAYGLRNPFRLAFRPGTSELWLGDVGYVAREEVDRLVDSTPSTAVNFGWPCREGPIAGPSGLQGADLCASLSHQNPYFSYAHGAPVSNPDCPTGGGSSIAGLAFADGGNYPPAYDGALFLADYSRDCIWAMPAGTNGLPSPAGIFRFAVASNPVQLKIGPEGDLYYVDFQVSGSVRRISYQGPVARISASPTSGTEPLTVQFSGSGSTVQAPPARYAWDLDGDGQYDDSTAVAPSRTYTNPGRVTVRLLVTDANDRTDTDQVVIDVGENKPPTPSITAPAAGTTWAVGNQIGFSGSATDAEDGTLPASRLAWTLVLHHCPSGCHEHVVQSWSGVASGSFTAPDHEYPSHLELRLTATDSHGDTKTVSRVLQPRTSTITLQTDPTGLQVGLGATTRTAPASATAIVGATVSISAPASQALGGVTYELAGWAHGGAAAQEVVAGSAPATYRAIYAAVGTPPGSGGGGGGGGTGFSDVAGSPFAGDIAWATAEGITTGCGGDRFCPRDPVNREQMASFLVRALGLTGGATVDRFSDIAGSAHRSDINRLAAAGISTGCGGDRFCPRDPVNREQMASFLARALELVAGAAPDRFSDIGASLHRGDINRMAAAGITTGCGDGRFCPGMVVTREQMVAFLRRALA